MKISFIRPIEITDMFVLKMRMIFHSLESMNYFKIANHNQSD